MSDEADISEPRQSLILASTIKLVTDQQKARLCIPSLERCRECGDKIPEKRRAAVPGCTLCVECQKWADKGGGFWP